MAIGFKREDGLGLGIPLMWGPQYKNVLEYWLSQGNFAEEVPGRLHRWGGGVVTGKYVHLKPPTPC